MENRKKNSLARKVVAILVIIATFCAGFVSGSIYREKQGKELENRKIAEKETSVQETTAEVTTVEETTAAPKPVPKKYVALTFDDGPGRYTMELLDTLEKYNAKATFFVCGDGLDRNDAKKILKRMDALHCDIGNHTVHHANLSKASVKKLKKEIKGVDKKVKKFTGHKTKFLRPPYGAGARSKKLRKYVETPMICWNVDTLDWKTKNKKKTVKRATKNIKDGDIILLHDIHSWSVEAVKEIVPTMQKQGYVFVTVSELANMKHIKLKKGKAYYDFQ
ncbi:MAG: polysaccharide deacetylase family protein [Eubacterium sp.]|nr:polysaccharide deacetylase family protein [Eubacterium sp.]